MKIIVGLGNPEAKQQHNRHNIGFASLDFIKTQIDPEASFANETKFKSLVCRLETDAEQILLIKPQTYMNSSGLAIKAMLDFYKLNPIADLLLIHDDLDISFGQLKLDQGKGPKQHNGVNNIVDQIKTTDFYRLRLGIAGDGYLKIKQEGLSLADNYVLKDFSQNESKQLPDIFAKAYQKLLIHFKI